MASNPDLSSDELRSENSLRIANYWLQFAANHIDMAKSATDRAEKAFAEASACAAHVPAYEADPTPIYNAESPHEARLVATHRGWSEYSGPWENHGDGPVAKKLVFSAEAVAAINRLTYDPNTLPSPTKQANPANSSNSNPQIESSSSKGRTRAFDIDERDTHASSSIPGLFSLSGNINGGLTDPFTEPLLTPSKLPGTTDDVGPVAQGRGNQTTLPFRPRHQATVTPPEPALARLAHGLEVYRNEFSRAQQDLEGLEERVGEIIDGNGRMVDNLTLRHLSFKRRGMFVDPEAEAEERRRFLKADREDNAPGSHLMSAFHGYSERRPAGRGMKDLGDLLGEDGRH